MASSSSSFLKECLASPHAFPLMSCTSLAALFWVRGSFTLSITTSLLGVAGTAAMIYIQPPVTIKPIGGRFAVGVREVCANASLGHPPVTVYYPTRAVHTTQTIPWLPFNDDRYASGMARYVGLPNQVLRGLRLCRVALCGNSPPVPLYNDNGDEQQHSLPIILFSHGLSGFGQQYAAMLSSVAARGAVVVSMTHMDTSAAFCRDATNSFAYWIDTTIPQTSEAREPQLLQRARESQSTLERILSGELLLTVGFGEEEVRRYCGNSRPRVTLAGHSFGGSTALCTALEEAGRQGQTAIAGVIAYDPWHLPLEHIMKTPHSYTTPTLLFHSEQWYRWQESAEFYDALSERMHKQPFKHSQKKHIDAINARIASVVKGDAGAAGYRETDDWFAMRRCPATGHLSCNDVSLFSPVLFRKPYQTHTPEVPIAQWAKETYEFALLHASFLN